MSFLDQSLYFLFPLSSLAYKLLHVVSDPVNLIDKYVEYDRSAFPGLFILFCSAVDFLDKRMNDLVRVLICDYVRVLTDELHGLLKEFFAAAKQKVSLTVLSLGRYFLHVGDKAPLFLGCLISNGGLRYQRLLLSLFLLLF